MQVIVPHQTLIQLNFIKAFSKLVFFSQQLGSFDKVIPQSSPYLQLTYFRSLS